tara:strand:+ start:318 stop:581 length:264 start_codon:yes stop_codon:yes gene_type:complete
MKWVHPLQGRTYRVVLAEELAKALERPVDAHKLDINPPVYRGQDGIAWEYITRSLQVFSWDTMHDCLKYGFEFQHTERNTYEISSMR